MVFAALAAGSCPSQADVYKCIRANGEKFISTEPCSPLEKTASTQIVPEKKGRSYDADILWIDSDAYSEDTYVRRAYRRDKRPRRICSGSGGTAYCN
jgi:hypothetical protein